MFQPARLIPRTSPSPAAGGLVNCVPSGVVRTITETSARDVVPHVLPVSAYIEAIVDIDFAQGQCGGDAINVLPSTVPWLLFQYRVPIGSTRRFGCDHSDLGQFGTIGTSVQTGIVTITPYGSIGVVVVRLKPEWATVFLREDVKAFRDTKINLDALFGTTAIALLEERLSAATTSRERIRLVSEFLQASVRPRNVDRLVARAIRELRRNPCVRIHALAARLEVSERHLSRLFQQVVGISPKQFARLARFEQVMAARSQGLGWADLSYACGFVDQAHMINEVDAVIGRSPEQAFRPLSAPAGETDAAPAPLFTMW